MTQFNDNDLLWDEYKARAQKIVGKAVSKKCTDDLGKMCKAVLFELEGLGLIRNDSEIIREKNQEVSTFINPWLAKEMFGGKWPEVDGFDFDRADTFKLDGRALIPYDRLGNPCFGLKVALVVKNEDGRVYVEVDDQPCCFAT